jgi:hypothetical protein
MTLQAQGGAPGVWVDPAWQAGQPGTFAVVIGVSRYLHLDGGPHPTPDNGQAWIAEARKLGQLHVSALAAFRFFCWLRDRYRMDGAPLAKCWLLLSPTADEQVCEPGIATHIAAPTLAACTNALRSWSQEMKLLPLAVKEASRSLFFFSGHGLEVHVDQQVLLPADYLAPPAPNYNDAISTQNLKNGLASLEVPYRFHFLDACRNDFPVLRAKRLQGADILSEDESALSYAGVRAAAFLHATASAFQAWQRTDPQKGISIFGEALLEGLKGQPDIELYRKNGSVSVRFSKLEGFVASRVVQLLSQAGAAVRQPVQPSGIVRDEDVTLIDAGDLPLRPKPVPPGPEKPAPLPTEAIAVDRAAQVQRTIDAAVTHSVSVTEPHSVWATNFAVGHAIFDHSETVTGLWSQARLYALGSHKWINADAIQLHKVERQGDKRSFRVEMTVNAQDDVGHWLQLGEAGCLLPDDLYDRPRFVIEFDLPFVEQGSPDITRLDVYLAADQAYPPLSEGARIWNQYRTGDVASAVTSYELGSLESMVREKMASYLGAVIGALVLLRANRLDLLHQWLRNLSNWFPLRSDGAVLWAEQLLRQRPQGNEWAINEASKQLSLVLERGLPQTGEGLSYAAGTCGRLLKLRDGVLARDVRAQLQRVQDIISEHLAYFQPGGLFAAYLRLPGGPEGLVVSVAQAVPVLPSR